MTPQIIPLSKKINKLPINFPKLSYALDDGWVEVKDLKLAIHEIQISIRSEIDSPDERYKLNKRLKLILGEELCE